MTRVALLSSEPIRPRMAGIGIRYLEFARRLPAAGIETVLISPASRDEGAALGLDPSLIRPFEAERLAAITSDCQAAVAQGQLANDLVLALPKLPTAIDLYDPWLVENLHYRDSLGLDPYRNDHATWVLQMARGDLFLCSSPEQRQFYLGFLTALGRVNPERLEADPDLSGLIAEVPFGLPDELPPHRPWLPQRAAGERRLLFGGLYDWYDPWTLLAAVERLEAVDWRLFVVRNPNPDGTPQRLFAELERHGRAKGWWERRVVALDWVPVERRFDLLRDVDALVAPHRPSLETRLSLRTRFLDAFAAGCPVVATEGGTIGRLIAEADAGWVVPPQEPEALAAALAELLSQPGLVAARRARAHELARRFAWDRALAPLVAFLRAPRLDPTKERFAFRPATVAPADRLAFRLRRRIRRLLAAS